MARQTCHHQPALPPLTPPPKKTKTKPPPKDEENKGVVSTRTHQLQHVVFLQNEAGVPQASLASLVPSISTTMSQVLPVSFGNDLAEQSPAIELALL